MKRWSRRSLITGCAALSATLSSSNAQATLVRGLTLPALVTRSRRIVLLQPLESFSHFVTLGGRRSVVTDTRVRVEDVIAKPPPETPELIVRTLGGRVGRVGELVHGQAELDASRPSLAFLTTDADGLHWVTGMAQGHYPIETAPAGPRLGASRNLPQIRDFEGSAVQALAGQSLRAARVEIARVTP